MDCIGDSGVILHVSHPFMTFHQFSSCSMSFQFFIYFNLYLIFWVQAFKHLSAFSNRAHAETSDQIHSSLFSLTVLLEGSKPAEETSYFLPAIYHAIKISHNVVTFKSYNMLSTVKILKTSSSM